MPVFRQPFAAAGGILFQKFHQRPEIRRMILMLQMRNLMRHDIADDKFRRQRQTPAVIDIIQRGTACPAGFRILYADVMHGFADFIRNGCRTGGKLFQRQLFNKVLDAAVQKFNSAGNIKNFVFLSKRVLPRTGLCSIVYSRPKRLMTSWFLKTSAPGFCSGYRVPSPDGFPQTTPPFCANSTSESSERPYGLFYQCGASDGATVPNERLSYQNPNRH